MTDTMTPSAYGVITEPATVRLQRLLPGPIEKVWSYITDSELRGKWLATGPMDLRVGGAYRVHMRKPDGTETRLVGVYREVDPPKKLVYTWAWETSPEMGETLVTVEFLERGRATEVVLKHELFPAIYP